MNIREEILKEHSKEQALKIAECACISKKNFGELIKCFLDKEFRVAQRAAWSVSKAAIKNPAMIKPHLNTIVDQLGRKDVHDAVVRNSIRVLEETEIPEQYHGQVMNACFQFIQTPSKHVAIKAFSLNTSFKLSKYYPEIKPELKLIIEDCWESETAAFKSRARKILKQIK